MSARKVTCSTCKGTGTVIDEHDVAWYCEACDGEGVVPPPAPSGTSEETEQ